MHTCRRGGPSLLALGLVSMLLAFVTVSAAAAPARSLDERAMGTGATRSWLDQFGSLGDDVVSSVAVMTRERIYVGGAVDGALPGKTHRGGTDAFIRAYSRVGELLWDRQFGSAGDDAVTALTLTENGSELWVAGTTDGALPGQTNLGGTDMFLTWYDRSGLPAWVSNDGRWIRQFGTPADDWVNGLGTVAGDDNYVLAGATAGAFPGQVNRGGADALVRTYTSARFVLMDDQFGTAGDDEALAAGANADGRIAVAGRTDGALTGTPGAGGTDAFTRIYREPDGPVLWTDQFGTAGDDSAAGVAVGRDDDITITGTVAGALPGATAAGGTDAFVRRYEPNGDVRWSRQFGTPADDHGTGVVVEPDGQLVLSGSTDGALPGQTSLGSTDAFLQARTRTGAVDWTDQFGTPATDIATAIDLEDGHVAVAGTTDGVFAGQTGRGQTDGFVSRRPTGPPTCNGLEATIVGTPGDDVLVGTPGPDVIIGRGGDDEIVGRAGDDAICGGVGDDRVFAGAGRDRVFGEGGDDVVRGGPDVDWIWGGSGDDVIAGNHAPDDLFGGDGNDRLNGGRANDALRGDEGRDRLVGGRGHDHLRGGAQDDHLEGKEGSDTIEGETGDDTLVGGGASDELVGGDGDDVVLGGLGDDFLFGNDGDDLLRAQQGDDQLDGGDGFDLCYGGPGINQFVRCALALP